MAMFVVYILIVIVFYTRAGNFIFVANALPALVTAIFFGQKKAMFVYAGCLLPDLILHQILTTQNFYSGATLSGIGVAVLMSFLLGRVRDMHEKIRELQTELLQSGRIDPLTNLFNRGALLDFAEQEFKQSERQHFAYYEAKTKKTIPEVFSVALISIDRFKELNELHGHAAGDEVLRTMGDMLSSFGLLRGTDLKGRYGGNEFLLIFPHTASSHASIPLKKLSEEFKSIQFVSEADRSFTVSFSCGVSQYTRNDRSLDDILQRGEEALSSAKNKGGNRIRVYETIEKQTPQKETKALKVN